MVVIDGSSVRSDEGVRTRPLDGGGGIGIIQSHGDISTTEWGTRQ